MLGNLLDEVISKVPPKILSRLLRDTPRPFLDWKRDSSFRYIVRYAYKNSPFYRKKFDALKIDPNSIKRPRDLGDFYTTPNDIIDNAEEFLCKSPEIVFESSGTTGKNKRVYFSQKELNDIGHIMATGLFLGGVTKKDRLVNGLDFSIWIPGMITQKCIEKSGIFGMAAGKVDPMEVYKRIPVYNFTVIMGEPTWLIKLTEIAEEKGAYPIKFIIGGAEEMPDAARPWMEKVWQGAQVRMVYASVESGGIIAFEPSPVCHSYHINENNFFVEIIDPDKDGYGEVAFTALGRRTMPLIRYRNHDVSKIIDQRCPCGLPYRRLAKMRGRTDEMVVASGGNLYPLMFEDILRDVEEVSTDWQVVFRLSGVKEVMELNLELKEGCSKDAAEKKIFSNIRLRYPDLWKNLSIGIFETSFVYHRLASLRANNRKFLRLIDKRYVK